MERLCCNPSSFDGHESAGVELFHSPLGRLPQRTTDVTAADGSFRARVPEQAQPVARTKSSWWSCAMTIRSGMTTMAADCPQRGLRGHCPQCLKPPNAGTSASASGFAMMKTFSPCGRTRPVSCSAADERNSTYSRDRIGPAVALGLCSTGSPHRIGLANCARIWRGSGRLSIAHSVVCCLQS